jgi:hypothetical protein
MCEIVIKFVILDLKIVEHLNLDEKKFFSTITVVIKVCFFLLDNRVHYP